MATGQEPEHRRSPDYLLAPENHDVLNRDFYGAAPDGYFQHRLSLLLLAAGKSDELRALLREGVQYGAFKAGGSATPPNEEDDKRLQHFITAESEVLLHHAAETLLRLYLAHEPLPACPPLEIARMRNFARFKKQVRKRFHGELTPEERRSLVSPVFYGANSPSEITPPPPDDVWRAGLDNIEVFLAYFASVFLDRSNAYNSAKHGLAIQAGEVKVQLGDGEFIKADGPALRCLEEMRNEDGSRRWMQATYWVDIDYTMGLISMAFLLTKALWSVGRLRYADGVASETPIRFFENTTLDTFAKDGFQTTKMAMELLYFADPVDEENA